MEPPTADPDIVSTDWVCVGCGYNLRSLSRSGRCPECNTPIARSLRTAHLASRSRAWLRTVRLGAMIVVTSNAAIIARGMLSYTAILIRSGSQFVPVVNSPGVFVTLSLVTCVGIWLLLQPEPHSMHQQSVAAAIWTRRLYLCASAAMWLIVLVISPFFMSDVSRTWYIGVLILIMVVEAMLCNYLCGLSQRIPDPSLALKFRVLTWLRPVSIATGILLPTALVYAHVWQMLTRVRSGSNRVNVLMHQGVINRVVALAYFELAVGVWATIVLWQFARALKTILRSPESDTSASTTPTV